MATDPITGLSLDQDRTQETLDYLGRSSPLGLAQQTALPGAQGASPSGGPASVGGTGMAAPAPAAAPGGGQSVGTGFGQNTFGPSVPGLGTQLGAAAAGTILGQGKGLLQNLIPSGADAGAGGILGSGGTLLSRGGDFVGAIPKEELLTGAGAEVGVGGINEGIGGGVGNLGASAGEIGAGSLLGAIGGWSAAYGLGKLALNLAGMKGGETTGNMWGDMAFGLLGPFGDVGKGITGRLLAPSSAWQNFGQNLGGTLYGESSAINTLVPWLGRAQTRGDIDQSLDLFRQLIEQGAGVGGYQLGGPTASGAPQVGQLPGAFGSKHEGGLKADFGAVTTALNDYISKLYDVLPEGGASSPLSYEAYAAGMPDAEFGNFMGLADQLLGLPLEQQQQMVAASGLPPDRQDQLLRYVGNPATYVERGLQIPEQFGGGNPMGFGYGGGQ